MKRILCSKKIGNYNIDVYFHVDMWDGKEKEEVIKNSWSDLDFCIFYAVYKDGGHIKGGKFPKTIAKAGYAMVMDSYKSICTELGIEYESINRNGYDKTKMPMKEFYNLAIGTHFYTGNKVSEQIALFQPNRRLTKEIDL